MLFGHRRERTKHHSEVFTPILPLFIQNEFKLCVLKNPVLLAQRHNRFNLIFII